MSRGVSVIICCHNSARRLPETMRHLVAQRVPADLIWEVVVVDNASTDGTAETALQCWPENAPAPLRIVTEPTAGLSHARLRGIAAARFDVLSFIDDDNWVIPDWVERVERIFALHPEAGACGGHSAAVFEISPPSWFEGIRGAYATGRQHWHGEDITDAPGTLLWGAGLNLRAAAVRQLLDRGFVFRMSGRRGSRMLAGEDAELCFALRAAGWRLLYDDALALRHFIPRERLNWPYALRLMRGLGASAAWIDLYLMALGRPPFTAAPAWKRTWGFQMIKGLVRLAGGLLAHPRACLGRTEGAGAALEFQQNLGRVQSLLALCGRYAACRKELEKAAWRLGHSPREL